MQTFQALEAQASAAAELETAKVYASSLSELADASKKSIMDLIKDVTEQAERASTLQPLRREVRQPNNMDLSVEQMTRILQTLQRVGI